MSAETDRRAHKSDLWNCRAAQKRAPHLSLITFSCTSPLFTSHTLYCMWYMLIYASPRPAETQQDHCADLERAKYLFWFLGYYYSHMHTFHFIPYFWTKYERKNDCVAPFQRGAHDSLNPWRKCRPVLINSFYPNNESNDCNVKGAACRD